MIPVINLLSQHRGAGNKPRLPFRTSLAFAVMLGAATAGALHLWLQGQVASQAALNSALSGEINRLQSQMQVVTALQTETRALAELHAGRNRPVQLLVELERLLPDDMHLSNLRQEGMVVSLRGTAPSEDSVSELLRRLAASSSWLRQPELVEVVGTVTAQSQEGSTSGPAVRQRVAQFTLRARMPVTALQDPQRTDQVMTEPAP